MKIMKPAADSLAVFNIAPGLYVQVFVKLSDFCSMGLRKFGFLVFGSLGE
jgi:hypothetical protein